VKHHRLKQNLTQDKVAGAASISRSTLSLLEKGETVTIVTLLKVLRVLDLLYVMDAFRIRKDISPIEYARRAEKERQRARPKEGSKKAKEDIGW
jgi:transcriptional regulator with XRE-family HTH domain